MAHALPSEILRTCTEGMLYCFFEWGNSVTDGFFSLFTLLGFCVVCYLATNSLGTPRAFGFGSFVGMLGAIWFTIIGLISWWMASVFILTGVIGLAVMVMNQR